MTKPFPVFDAHVDLSYLLRGWHPGVDFVDLDQGSVTTESLRAGNVRVIVNALFTPDSHNGPMRSAIHLQRLVDHAEANLTGLTPISGPNGMRAAFEFSDDPTAYLLMVENADPLLEYPVSKLRDMGVRVVGLTHLGSNRVADGNGASNPVGFTPKGRTLLGKLESKGMCVDVAHLSRPGLAQLPHLFGGPLCSSHTGFSHFLDTPRNLTDDTIRLVQGRGGVVGLALAPEMLAADGEADLELVYAHVDWFAQAFGVESLGLGTDFCGFSGAVRGLETAAQLPDLAERLLKAGYAEIDIGGIFGGNWLRFYERLYA